MLRGVTTDAFGHQIPGTAISLYSPDRVLQTRANQQGQFEFTNVPTGVYELEAAAPGFITKTVEALRITNNHAAPIGLTLAVASAGNCPNAAGISYESDRGMNRGELTGVVLDSKQPLPQATVYLTKTFGTHTQISQRTNEKGEFLFADLEAGPYLFKVSHAGYHDEQTGRFWIARENQTRVVVEVIKQGTMRVCQ